MLTVTGLGVRLGGVAVVDDVSLHVAPGEWVALLGPNGAGKTTVLRAVARLTDHTGTVTMAGGDVARLTRRRLARLVAMVPQHPELPDDMTVAEYVLLGRTPHLGYLAAEGLHDRLVVASVLDRLELAALAERPLGELSGGEAQRAVLARSLAQEAPLLLLDEPTSALDLGHQVRALELVDELRRERGLAVLSAMHDLGLAAQFADRVVLLDHGRVVASGRPDEVLTSAIIAARYGAEVRVIQDDDGVLAIVPMRRRPQSLSAKTTSTGSMSSPTGKPNTWP